MNKDEFVKTFENVFLSNISLKQRKKFHIGKEFDGYLWQVFNHELVESYSNQDAKTQFDNIDKNEALEIQYDNDFFGDAIAYPLSKEHMTASGIDKSCLPEFYVIGKNFLWCYVVTHEFDLCGPFFAFNPNFINK